MLDVLKDIGTVSEQSRGTAPGAREAQGFCPPSLLPIFLTLPRAQQV